jgi:hypothetical protein
MCHASCERVPEIVQHEVQSFYGGECAGCVPPMDNQGGKRWARKLGQIVARSDGHYLVRVALGRDPESGQRRHRNRTVYGGLRAAQSYLNRQLREQEQERDLEGSDLTGNLYLDRWLQLAARPKLHRREHRKVQEFQSNADQRTLRLLRSHRARKSRMTGLKSMKIPSLPIVCTKNQVWFELKRMLGGRWARTPAAIALGMFALTLATSPSSSG